MYTNEDVLLRIDQLLEITSEGGNRPDMSNAGAITHGTSNLLVMLYGPSSPQLDAFRSYLKSSVEKFTNPFVRSAQVMGLSC